MESVENLEVLLGKEGAVAASERGDSAVSDPSVESGLPDLVASLCVGEWKVGHGSSWLMTDRSSLDHRTIGKRSPLIDSPLLAVVGA